MHQHSICFCVFLWQYKYGALNYSSSINLHTVDFTFILNRPFRNVKSMFDCICNVWPRYHSCVPREHFNFTYRQTYHINLNATSEVCMTTNLFTSVIIHIRTLSKSTENAEGREMWPVEVSTSQSVFMRIAWTYVSDSKKTEYVKKIS